MNPPGGHGGGHHGRFDPNSQSTKDPKGAIKRLARTLKHDRNRIAVIVILLLIATISNVAAPKYLGDATNVIVDGITANRSSGIDFPRLAAILGFVVALYVVAAGLNFAASYMIRTVTQRLAYTFRKRAQEKIDRLPLAYIDAQQRGDLLSRVTNDIDNINQTLMQTLNQVITSVYTLIGVLAMMVWISWKLALLSLVVLPLGAFVMVRILKLSKPQFAQQWKKTGEVSSIIEESFTGLDVVTAFNLQHEFNDVFDQSNADLFEAGFKGQFLSQLARPVMGFVSNLSFVIVAVAGGLQVVSGTLTIGGIQAFIQYSRQLEHPIGMLASIANIIQSGAASSERVFEFLDTQEMAPDATATYEEKVSPSARKGNITFKNVSFGYEPGKTIIHDLTLDVHSGEQIAIVGPTGAGKTTLVNLLMRFYEIDSGEILLDGVPISEFSIDSLRDRIGMVLQDTWLFDGTIADNIAFGNPNASMDDVVSAARATGVDRLIRQLPHGYDTPISDDSGSLSAGEKQLLTIARAYLSEPDILILDEATSSVDTRTEMLVQRAMNELRSGRTSFVIAHRLSTIRDADMIIVMVDGDVVESGTHETLMARGGAYYDLYQSQFSGPLHS
ncbi:MAG: ABC transporter ATP-binding protein [Actinomycetaceae bacterium]|nr:ABC transporter ATP-binding protein/permease [Arcanobacterium sp.]MDD7504754.1 ABC transporter ATP-binding protein [Actinomycetaceae bacterium]MDY6143575.1 ABC transporter ATP-binding protein [Arcanobacterium sp.]